MYVTRTIGRHTPSPSRIRQDRETAASPPVWRAVHAGSEPRVRKEILHAAVRVRLRPGVWAAIVMQDDRRGHERGEPEDVVVEPDRIHEEETEAHQADQGDRAASHEKDLAHRHRRFVLPRHGGAPPAGGAVNYYSAGPVREAGPSAPPGPRAPAG